ncbi:hypothetical protein E0198_003653 [Clavispora lusitaniae]|nr:hypothetical protein E0198_003653 [Clavispora lusitaniae]
MIVHVQSARPIFLDRGMFLLLVLASLALRLTEAIDTIKSETIHLSNEHETTFSTSNFIGINSETDGADGTENGTYVVTLESNRISVDTGISMGTISIGESTSNPLISSLQDSTANVEEGIQKMSYDNDTAGFPEDMPENSTDECRFMSFEEWKKQKEEEASYLELSQSVTETRSSMPNDLELRTQTEKAEESKPEEVDQRKIYKDKFNYASVDCAATIVETNRDAKGASAILTEVKDSYLLNKCSTSNKFVVIELCQDILVTSVVMGNFELFSSMFKSLRFSVSDRFPVTSGWRELGEFEAQNVRDVQVFPIENPLIWARYLKIEIQSHYGDEFYCPISIVRVHGTTMMEEFKDTEQSSEKDEKQHLAPKKTIVAENFLNYTTDLDTMDDCRVVLPYLALNEFLKDQNSTDGLCEAPLYSNEESTSVAEASATKTTQESLFRNIVKRLTLLESNASLSLLYVEEQSKLLSDAFTTMERRQSSRLENVLSRLNQSFVAQVHYLHENLAQIKQESILTIENSQTWINTAIDGLDVRTSQFTRELRFQRKIIIIDTLIILLLVAYVIMSRELFFTEDANLIDSTGSKSTPRLKQFPVHGQKRKHRSKKRSSKFS